MEGQEGKTEYSVIFRDLSQYFRSCVLPFHRGRSDTNDVIDVDAQETCAMRITNNFVKEF